MRRQIGASNMPFKYSAALALSLAVTSLLPAPLVIAATKGGSCSSAADAIEAELNRVLSQHARTEPASAESLFALRGYQPTPATIAAAEQRASGWKGGEQVVRALERARVADAQGRPRQCSAELRRAKRLLAGHAR